MVRDVSPSDELFGLYGVRLESHSAIGDASIRMLCQYDGRSDVRHEWQGNSTMLETPDKVDVSRLIFCVPYRDDRTAAAFSYATARVTPRGGVNGRSRSDEEGDLIRLDFVEGGCRSPKMLAKSGPCRVFVCGQNLSELPVAVRCQIDECFQQIVARRSDRAAARCNDDGAGLREPALA